MIVNRQTILHSGGTLAHVGELNLLAHDFTLYERNIQRHLILAFGLKAGQSF